MFEKAKKIAGKDKEFHGFALITNSCANDASPQMKMEWFILKIVVHIS